MQGKVELAVQTIDTEFEDTKNDRYNIYFKLMLNFYFFSILYLKFN